MKNPLKQFLDISNETVNLINAKTEEQKKLHSKKLLEKMPNINPLFLLILEK